MGICAMTAPQLTSTAEFPDGVVDESCLHRKDETGSNTYELSWLLVHGAVQ